MNEQFTALVAFLALLYLILRPRARQPPDPLDVPVCQLGDGPVLTGRQLATGVLWLGGIGSGKTSCAANMLVSMLKHGYSAALYTVQVAEVEHLEKLIRLAGVDPAAVIRIGRGHPENTIDAANYVFRSSGESVEAVAQLVESLLPAVSGKGDAKEDSKGRFFTNTALNSVRHAVVILSHFDKDRISLTAIGQLVASAPTLRFIEQPQTEDEKAAVRWFQTTIFWEIKTKVEQASGLADNPASPTSAQRDLRNAITFFMHTWSRMANDTRSSVYASLSAMTELFSFAPLRDLTSERTTITPEILWEGGQKIFLLVDPVHAGIGNKLLQLTWKFLIQDAAKRRNTSRNKRMVVQWMDESPNLVLASNRLDSSFQAICRQKCFVNVHLAQNLAQYREILGSDEEANDWFSNIRCRVIMAVDEPGSQKTLSDMIGRSVTILPAPRQPDNREPSPWQYTAPASWHSQMDFEIPPHEWGSLQKARPPYPGEAIVYLGGERFADGRTYARIFINQLLT